VQHSTDREPRIRQNPQFAYQSGSGNPDRCINRPDVVRNEGARHDGELMAMQSVIRDSYQWMAH
jgi:hypothetical protein